MKSSESKASFMNGNGASGASGASIPETKGGVGSSGSSNTLLVENITARSSGGVRIPDSGGYLDVTTNEEPAEISPTLPRSIFQQRKVETKVLPNQVAAAIASAQSQISNSAASGHVYPSTIIQGGNITKAINISDGSPQLHPSNLKTALMDNCSMGATNNNAGNTRITTDELLMQNQGRRNEDTSPIPPARPSMSRPESPANTSTINTPIFPSNLHSGAIISPESLLSGHKLIGNQNQDQPLTNGDDDDGHGPLYLDPALPAQADNVSRTPTVQRRGPMGQNFQNASRKEANVSSNPSAGVYSDEPLYGSMYYGRSDNDEHNYESNYEYLNDEDRFSTLPGQGFSPPPLPPPNRRRSSVLSTDSSVVSSPSATGGTPWLHGNISREEAEAILGQDMRSGAFLVRAKVPDQQWALSIVWKGMFVHHLITVTPETRIFYMNDDEFPVLVHTLEDIIDVLRTKQGDSFRVIDQDLRHSVPPRIGH